jgi:hypothetical protein
MSSNGGGGSNLLDMGLMIAAGVAAPELAPLLMEGGGAAGATFMGLEGAGGLAAATGVTGAGLSGLTAAATGQDPLRAAAMGGLGGAASGYLGGIQAEQEAANAAQAGMTGNVNPNISTNPSVANFTNAGGANITSDLDPITNLQNSGALSGGAGNVTSIPQAPVFQPFNATTGQMVVGGGINALGGMSKPTVGAYTPPKYTGGNLSKFKYDPNNYTPDVVVPPRPVYQANYSGMAGSPYAEGGIASLAKGGSTDDGISSLGSYSDGGRLLKGPGDGMSDNIPAKIGGKQEARLADGEFVVPADVVSHLGNGSTDAGAKHLYKMMDKVRKARTGNPKQGKQINAEKYVPA